MGTSYVEYRKDCVGGKTFASRNYNDLKGTYNSAGSNRSQLDWNLTLRQVRSKKNINSSQSVPNLSGPIEKNRAPLTSEHEDGPYHSCNPTVGKYQNVAATEHMTGGGKHGGSVRKSGGTSVSIDWQLNLRDGYHQKPDFEWRRYFTRPQVSFDRMKKTCAANLAPCDREGADNALYNESGITPQDRRMDRAASALPIETISDDPISFKRWAGCEGTQVGQWRHMINDRRFGHKSRRTIQQETTLREYPGDTAGARICDNRSDGCIVEMLGKKKWVDPQHYEPLAARPPQGDAKLHYLTRIHIVPEKDEENREKRMAKQPRTDAHISEKSHAKSKSKESTQPKAAADTT